ncbi:MAG: aspartyl/asparaginyl beta-hydroxylase domain-containing protein [Hyphomonadaceae bacterium]
MTISLNDLRAAAARALQGGEHERARELLDQVIAGGGGDVATWLALSRAHTQRGDESGAGAAIDRALALDPHGISQLVAKGDHLSRTGDARAASAFYSTALRYMPQFSKLPTERQQELLRAKAANEKYAKVFQDFMVAHLEGKGLLSADAPARFSQAVDILLGRKRPFLQSPRQFYYPELPQIQFYPRKAFDWIEAVEDAGGDVLAELQGVLGSQPLFQPYLTKDATRPSSSEAGLMENPDWGAFFLMKDGAPTPGSDACPKTMAAMAHAPVPRIRNRTPHALFSKLAAGARIPPHTGMINVRLICHLALIIPHSCSLRVGNQVRSWEQGKCWVFDDTIEHEAWNGSDQDRYVLIFDVWRPELSEEERVAVAALCEAMDDFGGSTQAWNA